MELKWTTEQRKVKDLVPFEFNPRILTDEKKEKLIRSIQKFNLVEIPVINLDNILIAGHQRCKIMVVLGRGEEMIDVRVPNRMLTEKELKEYNVTSNVSVGIWDLDILESAFQDIDLEALGLDLSTLQLPDSLKPEEILGPYEGEFDDTVPTIPQTCLNDIYELNGHRLYCGDSTSYDQIGRLFFSVDGVVPAKADVVFTDPPYNVKISGLGSQKYSGSISKIHGEFKMASGEMSEEEFISFLTAVFTNLYLTTKEGSIHYICMDWKHIYELMYAGREVYDEFKQLCVWNKDNGGMGTFYRNKHELVFVFKKGDEKHTNNFELGQHGRFRTNVWDYPMTRPNLNNEAGDTSMHPTVKPLQMVVDALLDCSMPGQIALDIFGGSGTTLIAGEKTCRTVYLMELGEGYCDVIIRRWVKYMRDNNRQYTVKRNGATLSVESIAKYFPA